MRQSLVIRRYTNIDKPSRIEANIVTMGFFRIVSGCSRFDGGARVSIEMNAGQRQKSIVVESEQPVVFELIQEGRKLISPRYSTQQNSIYINGTIGTKGEIGEIEPISLRTNISPKGAIEFNTPTQTDSSITVAGEILIAQPINLTGNIGTIGEITWKDPISLSGATGTGGTMSIESPINLTSTQSLSGNINIEDPVNLTSAIGLSNSIEITSAKPNVTLTLLINTIEEGNIPSVSISLNPTTIFEG